MQATAAHRKMCINLQTSKQSTPTGATDQTTFRQSLLNKDGVCDLGCSLRFAPASGPATIGKSGAEGAEGAEGAGAADGVLAVTDGTGFGSASSAEFCAGEESAGGAAGSSLAAGRAVVAAALGAATGRSALTGR
jgi:hypothetical protein